MTRSRPVTEYIKETEYSLAKYKAVLSEFPDAKVSYYMEFTSKSVNSKYTKIEFERRRTGLFVLPYCEIKVKVGGKEEIIKVHSTPRTSRLIYIERWSRNISGKRTMKFSRLNINLKTNHFKDDMVNSCRAEIMKFIGDNPGYHLDTKYLEPRLKKLLMFI